MTARNERSHPPDVCAVILAASTPTPAYEAVWATFHGAPLVAHTVTVFEAAPEIHAIVLVVAAARRRDARALARVQGWRKLHAIVTGGPRRRDAALAGLQALPKEAEAILLHDGTRPLLRHALIAAALDAARDSDAASAAVPLKETIKRVDDRGIIQETPDRSALFVLQTPQIFWRGVLLAAHAALDPAIDAPDDAWMVRRMGHPVTLFAGDYTNLKIATPEDLAVAEAMWGR